MSLRNWVEQGWISEIETGSADIQIFLRLAERNINEALNSTHSDDWKFSILYAAIINIAACALRACGYRMKSSGSHYYLIESLHFTMNLDRDLVSTLDTYRKKRNLVTYEQEGCISNAEAAEIEAVAEKLLDQFRAWLRKEHPDLL